MEGILLYLCFAVNGDRTWLPVARAIVECAERLGAEVLTRHLVDDNPYLRWEKELGQPLSVLNSTLAGRNRLRQHIRARDIGNLCRSTHVIIEASGVSTGVGVEFGFLLGKYAGCRTTLCLCHKSRELEVSPMIFGDDPILCPKVQSYVYDDIPAARRIVTAFLRPKLATS